MTEHVRVAVIGAGFAGIGTAMRLVHAGERSFAVLEQAEEVGGTWRVNTYPGVACDVPSHLYSFSFAPRPDWSRRYASGAEILDYLRSCAATPGVSERIRTGTSLRAARWSAERARWVLRTSAGTLTASTLVLATGRFTEPHVPDIPGLAGFPGPVFHTARWQHGVDLAGLRVGVVGTGASAVQLVPELVTRGAQVSVFQRSAPWVIPKQDATYSLADRERFGRQEPARLAHRREIFEEMDAGFAARITDSVENDALRMRALTHLRHQVPDPAQCARLVPDYPIGCKRVLLSDDWYPALATPAVTLEDSALHAISGATAIAESGRHHELDALILATGFHASRPAVAAAVRGADGTLLSQHWRDGMTSYASTAVSGFPNCFTLGGPNSALGHNSALTVLETQISHLLSALDQVPEGSTCEVRAAAEQDYTAELDQRADRTVWSAADCSSWYRDAATGRITLLWPGSAQEYARRFAAFDPTPFEIHSPAEASDSDVTGSDALGSEAPATDTTVTAARLQEAGL